MTILYVDDDVDDRDIFRDAVKSIDERIVCFTANNGLDALSFLDSQTQLPDVVILDINMPLMNGKTCLAEIKSNSKMANLPVIIFTTSTNPAEIEECKKIGASDFVKKPASYLLFKETLTSIINERNTLFV
jgi:CheY-like chemotaxis protein